MNWFKSVGLPVLSRLESNPELVIRLQDRVEGIRMNNLSSPELYTGSDRVVFYGDTAILNIKGVIEKELSVFGAFCGGVSCDDIVDTCSVLSEMDSIKNVFLNVDSPGGSVSGLEVAADAIRSLRDEYEKTIVSFSNDLNASAAYWLSSSGTVFVNPSSATGSMGVVSIMSNEAKALEDEGIEVMVVRSTKMKMRPNHVESFTEDDRELVLDGVMHYADRFERAIAENRGISLEKAQAMHNGLVFNGADAIEAGFADAVGTLKQLLTIMNGPITLQDVLAKVKAGESIENDSSADASSQIIVVSSGPEASQPEAQPVTNEQLAQLTKQLEASIALNQKQAASIEKLTKAHASSGYASFVEKLVSETRVLGKHKEGMVSLLSALSSSDLKVKSGDDEVSALDFMKSYLNDTVPMVSMDGIVKPKRVTQQTEAKSMELEASKLMEAKGLGPAEAVEAVMNASNAQA